MFLICETKYFELTSNKLLHRNKWYTHTHTHTYRVYWKDKVYICLLNNPKSTHWHTVVWSPLKAGQLENSCQSTTYIGTLNMSTIINQWRNKFRDSPTASVRLSVTSYNSRLHTPTLCVISHFYEHRFWYKSEWDHTEDLQIHTRMQHT